MRGLLRLALLAFALVGSVLMAGAGPAQAPSNINELSLEVEALHILHELELSPSQFNAFIKVAHDASPKAVGTEAKASPEYRKTLNALRGALIRGDDEKMADLQEKLTQLQEKEQPELDAAVEMTAGAREQAKAALRLLSVRQLAVFIGTLELADPVELLIESLEHVRTLKADQDEEIDQIADEVAALAAAGDEAVAKKVKEKTVALLNKVNGIKNEAAFKKQKAALEQEARKLVGDMDSVAVLNRSLEQGMAEFLSNPRLESALKAIRTRRPAATTTPKSTTPEKKKKA